MLKSSLRLLPRRKLRSDEATLRFVVKANGRRVFASFPSLRL